jgi:hypothetical protein
MIDKPTAQAYAATLTALVRVPGTWLEPVMGPNYVKVVIARASGAGPSPAKAAFCFIARRDGLFGWRNGRAGDILAPMTWRRPWRMDAGAVGNILDPEDPVSYWVRRYGTELGLW